MADYKKIMEAVNGLYESNGFNWAGSYGLSEKFQRDGDTIVPKKIGFEKFARLIKRGNFEGIVLLGAGGELDEWIKGVTKILSDEGIIGSNAPDDHFYGSFVLTTSGGRTDLALVFNKKSDMNIGKMAMWRLKFGDASWISDYLDNYKSHHELDECECDTETKEHVTADDSSKFSFKKGGREFGGYIEERDDDKVDVVVVLDSDAKFSKGIEKNMDAVKKAALKLANDFGVEENASAGATSSANIAASTSPAPKKKAKKKSKKSKPLGGALSGNLFGAVGMYESDDSVRKLSGPWPHLSPLEAKRRLRKEGDFSEHGWDYTLNGPQMAPGWAMTPFAARDDMKGDYFVYGDEDDPIDSESSWAYVEDGKKPIVQNQTKEDVLLPKKSKISKKADNDREELDEVEAGVLRLHKGNETFRPFDKQPDSPDTLLDTAALEYVKLRVWEDVSRELIIDLSRKLDTKLNHKSYYPFGNNDSYATREDDGTVRSIFAKYTPKKYLFGLIKSKNKIVRSEERYLDDVGDAVSDKALMALSPLIDSIGEMPTSPNKRRRYVTRVVRSVEDELESWLDNEGEAIIMDLISKLYWFPEFTR